MYSIYPRCTLYILDVLYKSSMYSIYPRCTLYILDVLYFLNVLYILDVLYNLYPRCTLYSRFILYPPCTLYTWLYYITFITGDLTEHEMHAFELPPELADPQKSPCVNVPEWFVREGGELCLSDTANGTSIIRSVFFFM